MSMRAATLLSIFALIASACSPPKPPAGHVDVVGMDTTVAPGDDFAAYVSGSWRKATQIPPDRATFGAFDILLDTTRTRTQALIQDAAKSASNPDLKRIGDFYAAFMDSTAIESNGVAPLKGALDSIAAIADKGALAAAIGRTLRNDTDALNNTNFQTPHLFGVWVTQAIDDPNETVPYLMQGGIGMPERDYYVSTTPQMKELRAKYVAYVESMFKLAGLTDPSARAARVMALETKFAQAHATLVECEDVHAPKSFTRDDLAKKAPGVDWSALLTAAQLGNAKRFIAWQPKAIVGLAALVASEPLDAWKDWLAFHAIDDGHNFLSKAFVDAGFEFYGKALSGTPQLRPRWKRGVDYTSAALGEVVGKEYVARWFPPETKKRVQDMVSNLIAAFGVRIDSLAWMTPATKAKAKAKLATLRVGVGYPDKWGDYSSLRVDPKDAYGNAQRAELFQYQQALSKIGKPVDRSEWWMTPQTVNAVNLPLQNALNFPAAIIAPPFFDATANDAYNYGSMGAVIGHEISHTFDSQGAEFDSEGRLANWWTKADFDHFKAAGEALAKQYDAYKPFPDLAVNGHQTLGENIADVAGLADAYDAYRTALKGQELAPYMGLTGDQQFFIAFGQSWRTQMRDKALRQQVATDVHAPDAYRAATVRNIDAWYKAFSPKIGQKLFLEPKDRVKVW